MKLGVSFGISDGIELVVSDGIIERDIAWDIRYAT